MNFLFIAPTLVSEAPMTIGMLSAVLKQERWNTHSIVNTFNDPLEIDDFVERAKEVRADMVGITIMTFEVLFIYKLIKALKDNGFFVIVGGAHTTDCPEEVLEAGADIAIIGEGEETLREIVQGKRVSNILGIAYKEKSEMIINQPRPRLDIDKLPSPDLEVFDKKTFTDEEGFIKGFHRIYTSRGCPGCCTFCDWQVFKQIFKTYKTEKIIAGIKMRRDKYGINSFSIADDCFTVDRKRAMEFCKQIKKLNVVWRANSRANLVDLELLKAMKDAGCHSIAFGLESGDPETLKLTAKRVTLEENIKAPKLAHKAGLEVYGCLMVGFPWETPKHIENQIKFIHELWDDVSLFQVSGSLMPYPGTAIYRQYAKKYGFEKFWLKPDYQGLGIQIYQNALNPYKVSTYYQRYLFDDTYIQQEYFFTYTPEYKKAVRKMVKEIGRHNLRFMFPNQSIKKILLLSKLSMMLYDLNPKIEMKIGGWLFKGRAKVERVRDKRRGIKKTYDSPN